MRINPVEIKGNWDKGFVLDMHILSSIPKGENVYGHMEFDNIRTELGELVYQLKYHNKYENINIILDLISPFIDNFTELHEVDIVMPVPPSKDRDFQPVFGLALAIAQYLNKNYTDKVLEKTTAIQSKDMDRSRKNLKGSIIAKYKAKRPCTILLIDDLFSTGETIFECVSALKSDSFTKNIYVLVMTKTR